MTQKKVLYVSLMLIFSLWPLMANYLYPALPLVSIVLKIGMGIYLLIINGWMIFTIIFPRYPEGIKKVVYSISLSILFDMLVGFLVAAGFYSLGIEKPFNITILSWTFSGFSILLSGILLYLLRVGYSPKIPRFNLNNAKIKGLLILMFSFLLSLIAIIGAVVFKYTHYGGYIAIAWVGIALLPVIVISYSRSGNYNINTLRLLTLITSLTLTVPMLLGTQVILGTDGHPEVYVSKTVLLDEYWTPHIKFEPANTFAATQLYQLYSILSDSILAPLFSVFLEINVIIIMKSIIPAIFSVVFPLVLYEMYREAIENKVAFLATLVVMFFEFYYYNLMAGGARQPIAELFLVMLLLGIFDGNLSYGGKFKLLPVLTLGIVLSHYGTSAYYLVVFMFAMMALLLGLYLQIDFKKIRLEIKLLSTIFLFLLVIFVSWNALVYSIPHGTFKVITLLSVSTIKALIYGMPLDVGAKAMIPTHLIAPKIEMGVYLLLYILGGIGIIYTLKNKLKSNSFSISFWSISIGAFIAYGLMYPIGTANAMSSWRSAHLSMIAFAPLSIYGSCSLKLLVSTSSGNKGLSPITKVVIALLLSSMLLFGSTIAYSFFHEHPYSIRAIFFYEKDAKSDPNLAVALYSVYPQLTDISAAMWYSSNSPPEPTIYGCDYYKRGILRSYAMIPYDYKSLNLKKPLPEGYIYLGYINVGVKFTCDGTSRIGLDKFVFDNNLLYTTAHSVVILNQ